MTVFTASCGAFNPKEIQPCSAISHKIKNRRLLAHTQYITRSCLNFVGLQLNYEQRALKISFAPSKGYTTDISLQVHIIAYTARIYTEIMMTAIHTTLFKSNKTQAVRLPKPVALPESIKKVDIVAIGNTRIITRSEEHTSELQSH